MSTHHVYNQTFYNMFQIALLYSITYAQFHNQAINFILHTFTCTPSILNKDFVWFGFGGNTCNG